MSVKFYPCIFKCCVLVNFLVKQFAICLNCGCYLVECYGRLVWVEVLCWIDRVWSSKGFVCCVWGPSVHPSDPFHRFLYVGKYLLI